MFFTRDIHLPAFNCQEIDVKMKFFLCVIGMVMIIEGIPYFGFPKNMKQMMKKVMEIPDDALRKFGFVLMLTGLLLVYFGKM